MGYAAVHYIFISGKELSNVSPFLLYFMEVFILKSAQEKGKTNAICLVRLRWSPLWGKTIPSPFHAEHNYHSWKIAHRANFSHEFSWTFCWVLTAQVVGPERSTLPDLSPFTA